MINLVIERDRESVCVTCWFYTVHRGLAGRQLRSRLFLCNGSQYQMWGYVKANGYSKSSSTTMACENEYEENVDSLRKLFKVNNIVSFSIQQMKCSAGSSSGDNYMSVVKRIQIRGHRSNHHKGMTYANVCECVWVWVRHTCNVTLMVI